LDRECLTTYTSSNSNSKKREKTSQAFRDAAFDHYKSSSHIRSQKKKDARSESGRVETLKLLNHPSEFLSESITCESNQLLDKSSIDDCSVDAAEYNTKEIANLEHHNFSLDNVSEQQAGSEVAMSLAYHDTSYESTYDQTITAIFPVLYDNQSSVANAQSYSIKHHERHDHDHDWCDSISTDNAAEIDCYKRAKRSGNNQSFGVNNVTDQLEDEQTFELLLKEMTTRGTTNGSSDSNILDDQTLDLLLEMLPTSSRLRGSDSEGTSSSSIETIDQQYPH
jgi:hypothetical protein